MEGNRKTFKMKATITAGNREAFKIKSMTNTELSEMLLQNMKKVGENRKRFKI